MSKQPPPAPTTSAVGPCPTLIQISRTPRHCKFTQHHRTTRPPPPAPSHHPTTPSFGEIKSYTEKVKYPLLVSCYKFIFSVSSEDGGPGDGNNDGRNRGKLTLNGMHWIERMKRNADMKDDMKKRSVDQQKIHI